MSTGRIIRGIGGFYYVLPDAGEPVVECKARGHFRKSGISPVVGDLVVYADQKEGHSSIEKILPRKNLLIRPSVANIDQLLIVVSASAPAPDWQLVDKLIIQAVPTGIKPVLILNKSDAADERIVRAFEQDYVPWFQTAVVSARTGTGKEQLADILKDRVSCFAGQSAVGKSSLINLLLPELALETGDLAKKTDRGRHTTRRAELWPAFGGAILDTPGFSLYETDLLEQTDLNRCYPEFGNSPEKCRFPSCMHVTEPGCAIKELVAEGKMSPGRYERYTILAKEYETRRKHIYG
ncbi:MAG: ribosome small subunit-dependent GTPase A [Clostridiales bacterium]|nr:ribosome small subunit-dependent GTPase A [Clostridiales bacterium]